MFSVGSWRRLLSLNSVTLLPVSFSPSSPCSSKSSQTFSSTSPSPYPASLFYPNPCQGNLVCKDPETAKLYDEDPLVHGTGTLLGMHGMLTEGDNLFKHPPVIDAPLLVQHGTHDKITDFGATKEFFAKLPVGNADREFKAFDGYYHELHNEREDERNVAIRYIADWIVARVGEPGAPKAKL